MARLRIVVEFEHTPNMDEYDFDTPEEALDADIHDWMKSSGVSISDLFEFLIEANPQVISLEKV